MQPRARSERTALCRTPRWRYRSGGDAPGEAILAFTACSALDDHRAYRLPHADHWRLEALESAGSNVGRTGFLALTYGAPLAAPGRRLALLRFEDDDRPELDGLRLEPVEDDRLASVLAGAGYGQEEPCGIEPDLEVRSWLLRSERSCVAPSECVPDSLYVSVVECRAPFRHEVFRMPTYPRWTRPLVDGFDEGSGNPNDPGSRQERRPPAREVVLEWWGGVPTRHPSEGRWWDWSHFDILVAPDGARLVRTE